jgi:hypothetical protein
VRWELTPHPTTPRRSVRVEQDTPVPLKNGDTVSMGDTHLTVQLLPVASEEAAADENAPMEG